MTVAERVDLAFPRNLSDLGQPPARGFNNPFGILETSEPIERIDFSLVEVQKAIGEIFGSTLPRNLTGRLGIRDDTRFELIDHPRSSTSIWLGSPSNVHGGVTLEKSTIAVVIGRGDHYLGNEYTPNRLMVSGIDQLDTDRPIAVNYSKSENEDQMIARSIDVAVLQEEVPSAHREDYRFCTLPIPTPTELSWHNMYAAGFITEGMIPRGDDGELKYPMIIQGRSPTSVRGFGAGTGNFNLRRELLFDDKPFTQERASLSVRFVPDEGSALEGWYIEVPLALEKTKSTADLG